MQRFVSLLTIGTQKHFHNNFVAQGDAERKEMIAVYLKPESKVLLEKALKKIDFKDPEANHICINSAADKDTVHMFEPLFGSRAAFRLKGLLILEDGTAVGLGRVSNMAGVVKDSVVEASLPILEGNQSVHDAGRLQMLHDLPSRLYQIPGIDSKHFWKGRLPTGKVDDRKYPATSAQYIKLPIDKQTIVDGYLCSNFHVNNEGKCEFDQISDKDEHILQSESKISNDANEELVEKHKGALLQDDGKESQVDSEFTECPVCKFLKGGPCKEEFIAWDSCLKSLAEEDDLHSCFSVTKTMMQCMKKHEYYDIMIAGTDFERVDAIENEQSKANE
jgi:hypothetical protein